MGCGAIPLRSAIAEGDIVPDNVYAHLGVTAFFGMLALTFAWMMAAVGPEGVSLDTPLPLPHDVERWVKRIAFSAITGVGACGSLALALASFGKAVPALGRTVVVAVAAPIAGLAAWVAIEPRAQAFPPRAPLMNLTFDNRFPGVGYLARAFGYEVFARPARSGPAFSSANRRLARHRGLARFRYAPRLTVEFRRSARLG